MTAEAFSLPRYLSFLRETEGPPDLASRTLPRREAFFRDLPGIPLKTPLVDAEIFSRNVVARTCAAASGRCGSRSRARCSRW
jgi:hypothetical protein